jgi:hypothetical protein
VTVRASSGTQSDTQALAITVTDTNDAPRIVSNGGGIAAALNVTENAAEVTTVAATDQDGNAVRYSISGGLDATHFVIDTATGTLSFLMPPDFEAPADADGDNVYDVAVSASDGSRSDTQTLAITVGNANEAPRIVSNGGGTSAALELDEGQAAVTTVLAQDPDGPAELSYAIAGGLDAALFAIHAATGALSFIGTPDYEAPADQAPDNFYTVIVTAGDGTLSTSQAISVLIRNVNEAVGITSSAAVSVLENDPAATIVTATDLDGDSVAFSIAGGADSARFAIDTASGALSFVAAPDFDAPADADGDNVYEVVVSVSDGSLSDSQALAVSVGNVNEAPVIVSDGGGAAAAIAVSENATAVTTVAATDPEGGVTYALAGGADAGRFAVNASTGALSFIATPDFDAPADADGNNVYEVLVSASDGTLADTQALSIAVGNLFDGLTLTGGIKADAFRYEALSDSTVAASDRILDFNRSQGDKIEMVEIDANTVLAGNQAFSFIGTAAFSNVAGQLRYFQQNGDTFVCGDVNGDGAADFQIVLDPLVNLISSDFHL